MSARSHVDVSERRLRPIYDCLDYGNNKKAIQEADKVLKKQKNFNCAKALKALALLRLGRQTDGSNLLQEVHQQSPTDEATLQAMAICYREMHRLDLIADMYSNAHKAKPDSEDILTALFMAYVRLGDYKKQQQTAMTLHRLRPGKNPYYFWAVMSIVMQAHGDLKLGKTMFLPLAERMTHKYVADDKIEAEAEVRMFLIILEQLEKYEEALSVINGPLGEKLNSELNYKITKNAELLVKLERWPEASAAYRKMLQDEPDQWSFYLEYFNALFKLMDADWKPTEDGSSEECVDYTIQKASTFIAEQEELASQCERPMRGPHLARLELFQQLVQREAWEEAQETAGDPVEMFVKYFNKFGSKYCCFSDIKSMLLKLKEQDQQEFLKRIQECSESEVIDENADRSCKVKNLQRHITVAQLCQYLGKYRKLDSEQRTKIKKELLEKYEQNLELGTDLLPTELQYCDSYLHLVSHLLYEDWCDSGDDNVLWQAIVLLEKGLMKSPSNFQFKLLLIQFYCRLGAFGPCKNIYESLEIKHIQNDALGYVIANHVGRLGHFSSAGILYDAMLRFFTLNHKDTTEYLISSYKYGSFTKVQEFVQFRERLQNSIQYASATAERLLLDITLETNSHEKTEEILSYMDIDPEKDKTSWPDLRDNRDLSVMDSWEPKHSGKYAEEVKQRSFEEEKAWLKVRNLTVRCVAAAIKLGMQALPKSQDMSVSQNNLNNGEQSPTDMAEVLADLSQQLQDHTDTCRAMESGQYPIAGPFRTRLCTYLAQDIGQLFADAISCVLYVHKLQNQGLDQKDEKSEEVLKSSIVDNVLAQILSHKKPIVKLVEDKAVFQVESLENLVLITESIGFLTVMAGVCHRILKVFKSTLLKKGKKKKENPVSMPPVFGDFATFAEGLEKCAVELKNVTSELDPACLELRLESLNLSSPDNLLQGTEELQQNVWQKMESSYQESTKEIVNYLENKLKYISGLKL